MKSINEIHNDHQLFIDIQMSKYFKLTHKNSFDNDKEAKLVLNEIIKTYNENISSEHLKLDNLNSIAKISWFNQIDTNFSKIINKKEEFVAEFDEELEIVSNKFDKIFYYLPKGAMPSIVFSGPALDAFGLPIERFENLIKGEKATEFEKDLITWAFKVASNVIDAFFCKSKHKKQNALDAAADIAIEYLDRDITKKVIQDIFKNISDTFDINPDKINQTTKRKKKK